MIKAAITPGNQQIRVKINTINKDPHPLSITDNGGNIIHNIALSKDIFKILKVNNKHQ